MKRAGEGNDERQGGDSGPPSARRAIKKKGEDDAAQEHAGIGRAFGNRDLVEGVVGGERARPENESNVVEQEDGSRE
jgi:hypothetical protein